MRGMIIGFSALAIATLPTLAFADGDGALTAPVGPPCNSRTTTTTNNNTGASVTRETTDCPD